FQAEDGIRDFHVTGVQTCALPIFILRLNMRGADRSGVGVYHAGLYDEIIAAIGDPLFSRIERVFLFGYSMGGHTAMRLAALDPRSEGRRVGTGWRGGAGARSAGQS